MHCSTWAQWRPDNVGYVHHVCSREWALSVLAHCSLCVCGVACTLSLIHVATMGCTVSRRSILLHLRVRGVCVQPWAAACTNLSVTNCQLTWLCACNCTYEQLYMYRVVWVAHIASRMCGYLCIAIVFIIDLYRLVATAVHKHMWHLKYTQCVNEDLGCSGSYNVN